MLLNDLVNHIISEIKMGIDQFNSERKDCKAFLPEEIEIETTAKEHDCRVKFKIQLKTYFYKGE